MPIDPSSIADETSTVPANSEEAPDTGGIPEDVLALPIMRGLLSGAPAAVWTPIGSKGPEIETVLKHGKELVKAGFSFYRSKEAGLDLFYNTRFLSPELIEKADEKNKLKEVASPLEEVSAALNGSVGEPTGVVEPGAASGGPPSSVPVDSSLNTARVNSLQPGGPTSGNSPGAGRVLNGIQKSVI